MSPGHENEYMYYFTVVGRSVRAKVQKNGCLAPISNKFKPISTGLVRNEKWKHRLGAMYGVGTFRVRLLTMLVLKLG